MNWTEELVNGKPAYSYLGGNVVPITPRIKFRVADGRSLIMQDNMVLINESGVEYCVVCGVGQPAWSNNPSQEEYEFTAVTPFGRMLRGLWTNGNKKDVMHTLDSILTHINWDVKRVLKKKANQSDKSMKPIDMIKVFLKDNNVEYKAHVEYCTVRTKSTVKIFLFDDMTIRFDYEYGEPLKMSGGIANPNAFTNFLKIYNYLNDGFAAVMAEAEYHG